MISAIYLYSKTHVVPTLNKLVVVQENGDEDIETHGIQPHICCRAVGLKYSLLIRRNTIAAAIKKLYCTLKSTILRLHIKPRKLCASK